MISDVRRLVRGVRRGLPANGYVMGNRRMTHGGSSARDAERGKRRTFRSPLAAAGDAFRHVCTTSRENGLNRKATP